MDGWMDRWMDVWMDKWTNDRQTNTYENSFDNTRHYINWLTMLVWTWYIILLIMSCSISAPAGYQNNHNSFSKSTNLSLVMSSDKPVNENNSFPSSSRISHVHSASGGSITTPLIETSEELIQRYMMK